MQDVVTSNNIDVVAAGALDALAKEDGDALLSGALSGDVVWLVVLVGARDGQAAGSGLLGLRRVHHHDTVSGLGVDNGRDVKVVCAAKAIPAELGEETGDVGCSIIVGVGVADPTLREVLADLRVARDGETGNGGLALRGSEDNVASGTVLVDELSSSSSCERGERAGRKEESAGELHLEGCVKL